MWPHTWLVHVECSSTSRTPITGPSNFDLVFYLQDPTYFPSTKLLWLDEWWQKFQGSLEHCSLGVSRPLRLHECRGGWGTVSQLTGKTVTGQNLKWTIWVIGRIILLINNCDAVIPALLPRLFPIRALGLLWYCLAFHNSVPAGPWFVDLLPKSECR